MDVDDLQRAFFDGLYRFRIELALVAFLGLGIVGIVAWRRGWLAAARRHRGRTGALVIAVLISGLPLGWYVASPLWIRTELVEPDPAVILDAADATPSRAVVTVGATASLPRASATPSPKVDPAPFAARRLLSGSFRGTDDFHYGRGTASIIETSPGRYTLRLEAFSVRNGPDLFVYLSHVADDYAKGALELGRLKATDGAFGYALPPGTDPHDFASAIIWCKQFSHLFAVAPLAAG